jgi:hypothetical protein
MPIEARISSSPLQQCWTYWEDPLSELDCVDPLSEPDCEDPLSAFEPFVEVPDVLDPCPAFLSVRISEIVRSGSDSQATTMSWTGISK